MSNVYSASRPATGNFAQSPAYAKLEDYAYGTNIQSLLHNMLSDLLAEQPENTIDYMLQWLEKEKAQTGRQEAAKRNDE